MIAGRLRWREPGQKAGVGPKLLLGVFEFSNGTLFFTEAARRSARRCSSCGGRAALAALDPAASSRSTRRSKQFREALTRENHTLKRALTDPRLFSGIGNAYSDEILHAARLSPLKLTRVADRRGSRAPARRDTGDAATLDRPTAPRELAGRFPEKVTAFHEGMAVHGRFGSRVRSAARRCSASCTPTTSATTARAARPAAGCWPIASLSRLLGGTTAPKID